MSRHFITYIVILMWVGTGCVSQSTEYHIAVIASGQSRLIKLDGLRDGLENRGYVLGETLHLHIYDADNEGSRLENLLADALATSPNVLVTLGGIETQAALQATNTPPIIFIGTAHTVEWGVVNSIREPGQGITGIDNGYIELTGKRMEWASRLLPTADHMTILYSPGIVPSEAAWEAAQEAAELLGLTVAAYPIASPPQQSQLINDFDELETDALVIAPSYLIENALDEVIGASEQTGIPLIGLNNDETTAGALLSYGASFYDMGYQAADLVDKVLRDIPTTSIPVEFPDRPELTINMGTVDTLNLTLSLELLPLADEVLYP